MSEKECDQCFEMVEDDESLCEDCEEQERQLDEEDDALETCVGCGFDFHPSELTGDLCDSCIDDEVEGE